jgi:carbonic anhydrase
MKSTFLISASAILLATFVFSHASAEGVEFGYVGAIGPAFWHELSENNTICETGKRQSPIDITSEDLKTLAESPSPKFYDAKNVKSKNTGNTVEIFSGDEEVPLPAEIHVDGEKYELAQFHFHTPSEHRINGRHYDIEQHLVFKSGEKISVVAVFYDVGKEESAFMKPIINDLPVNVDDEPKHIKHIKLADLLCDIENITEAYTYSGSLTTPPCSEGVTWYVNKNPQEVSVHQFLKLREVMGFNSRFTQLRESDEEYKTKRSLYHRSRFQ